MALIDSGKQYLVDLSAEGFPVTPTVDRIENIARLGECARYVIKPKDGADSIGLEFLTKEELLSRNLSSGEMLIQPAVDFLYEVSFYYVNDRMVYAMYAPDKGKRWARRCTSSTRSSRVRPTKRRWTPTSRR